jgi:DNA-binding beta-propeller fold protein YncE
MRKNHNAASGHHPSARLKNISSWSAGAALATSFLALTLAAPASATPPIPTLTNNSLVFGGITNFPGIPNFSGGGGFTGQSVGVVVDPNTGNIYWADLLGDVWATIQKKGKPDVNLNPNVAAEFAVVPPTSASLPTTSNSTLVSSVIQGIPYLSELPVGSISFIQDLAIDTKTQNVFVPGYLVNQIFVINEATNDVIYTISIKNPWAVAVDETTGTLYVGVNPSFGSSPGSIAVIDEKNFTVKATIPVGKGPEYLAVDTKNHQLFVSDYTRDVTVIDTKTNTVKSAPQLVGLDAAGLAFDSKTDKLYVANYFQGAPNAPMGTVGSFYVVDAKTLAVTTIINAPVGCNPLKAVADSAHATVYALCYGQNFANGYLGFVIDEATDTVAGTFPTLPNALALALDSKSGLLFTGSNADQYGGVAIYQTNQ